MLFLLSKIVFYGVQKLKGKHVFRKIEIIQVRHIVSSVAQKQNSMDFSNSSCKLAMLSKVSYQKSRIASPQVIWILKSYNRGFKCSLNFFHVFICKIFMRGNWPHFVCVNLSLVKQFCNTNTFAVISCNAQ